MLYDHFEVNAQIKFDVNLLDTNSYSFSFKIVQLDNPVNYMEYLSFYSAYYFTASTVSKLFQFLHLL